MHWKYIFIFLFLTSCEQKTRSKPESCSFYSWQTTWAWSQEEQHYFKELGAKELYIRFFDLDWNEHQNQAVPVSALRLAKQYCSLPAEVLITPTIFITNKTIYNLPEAQIADLAGKLWKKVQAQASAIFPHNRISAVQLDCDWSAETREKYFKLCKALKPLILPAKLSATIRLHQVKYAQKTGLPPIDKGVLMCYNVGKIDGSNTQNSILDIDILRSYAAALASYPISVDIALPTFAWGVLKREGRVINLLNHTDIYDLKKPSYENINLNIWRVKKQHYMGGVYLYEDDEIRIEKTTPELLEKAIYELSPYLKNKKYKLIFYHLHKGLSNYFPINELKKFQK